MSETATCKRTLEFHVPAAEVAAEASRVLTELQKKVNLPGFRPGKVPVAVIKNKFPDAVRQEIMDSLIPKVFTERARKEDLKVIDGSPKVTDAHFHDGQDLHFKVDFEVSPEFDLGEYKGLTTPYEEPAVSDEDVEKRLDLVREEKADYVNIDPRPLENGDYAAVALRSIAGLEGKPMESNDMILHIGSDDTLPEFSAALPGLSPGDEKDIEVAYPENYGHERLAGKKVTFHVTVKAVRRKEIPEANDDFAADMGDFKSIEEYRQEIRRTLVREREYVAQQNAKGHLIDELVKGHEFPVPQAYVDRQIEMNLEGKLRELAGQGIDPRQLKIDWEAVRSAQGEQATKDVKASLILGKIAERESLYATNDEVDRELNRMARQLREPVAAVRMKFEKDGTLGRIANRISTEKVLNHLFENSRKVAPEAKAE
ncbi:MAG: trigger factor [Bryobacteraceae bacterium]